MGSFPAAAVAGAGRCVSLNVQAADGGCQASWTLKQYAEQQDQPRGGAKTSRYSIPETVSQLPRRAPFKAPRIGFSGGSSPMKRVVLALLALVAGAGVASAQDKWPSQPIRIVNAFAAGGATDITLRTAAEELRDILGVNVVVENKPGANGIIAMEEVSRRPADGYTLLGGPSSMSSGLLSMKDKLSFDFDDKFTIVSPVGEGPPSMILVRKELGIKDWKSLVAYSKANPGKIRYASPGALTGPHMDMMILAHRIGVDWVHLPQKGGGGILKAISNGDANIALLNIAVAAPLLKSGEVIPVVSTFDKRIKNFPDVPPLAEVGIKGVGNTLWHAIWAPAGTPPEVMNKLFDGIQKSMKGKRMQALFERAEMWGPELKSVNDSKTWFNDAMKAFIATADEAKPLIGKK
jgi:tripartite-type tricarboxylate transporter receptor subunit TctC